MVFNSFSFIIFFVAILSLIYCITNRFKSVAMRNLVLLFSSYYLYASFNLNFLFILIYVTVINYFAAKIISTTKSNKKSILYTSIVFSLIPLFVYKYLKFFLCDIFNIEYVHNIWLNDLILPVGISFYTFQALSYTIDVYRQKIECRNNFINISLFIAFFPTLLSGPIEKARNLLPQLEQLGVISFPAIAQGCTIFVWGLFKKVVIADRLSLYVNMAYGDITNESGLTLAVAALCYSIQIYCDFSGYSDMAIGIARSLGIIVSNNFNYPYFTTSIKSFWRRWHISLTSWFTEYVYFSLGGNRVTKLRWLFNISAVFILSGIWHGASWNFLVWGALHAFYYLLYYSLGLQTDAKYSKIQSIISGVIVFILISIAWIFFRVENIHSAIDIIIKISTGLNSTINFGASTFSFAVNILLIFMFILFEWMLARSYLDVDKVNYDALKIRNISWAVFLLIMISMFSVSNDSFVYFQF